MGIAFVLLAWTVFGAICAGITGAVAASVVARLLRSAAPATRRHFTTAAACLPAVGVAYALLGFIGYGLWCERYRNVDSGLGDVWRVPIIAGYSLVMIDAPENAFLESPTHRQPDFGITGLAVSGSFILGSTSEPSGFFLIHSATGDLQTFSTSVLLRARCETLGFSQPPLESPERFYYSRRWGRADLLAALLILSPALLVVVLFIGRLMLVVRSHQTYAPTPGGT